jgi:hypothetical protein
MAEAVRLGARSALLCAAACTAVHAAPKPVGFATARAAVIDLYRLRSIPVTPAEKNRYFSADLSKALIADSARDDEVGIANDGDYRYDAQDIRVTELRIGDIDRMGEIRVSFRNFGKPAAVTYDLCQRGPNDWRIKDVTTPSGGSLRKLLGLAAAHQTKGC